jgi:hypothetical protein
VGINIFAEQPEVAHWACIAFLHHYMFRYRDALQCLATIKHVSLENTFSWNNNNLTLYPVPFSSKTAYLVRAWQYYECQILERRYNRVITLQM